MLGRIAGPSKDDELSALHQNMKESQNASIRELFRPGLRVALLVGIGLAILQQFVGINTIIYYAPTIFGYAGFKSASGAILVTSVVGVMNVVATIVAIFLVDRLESMRLFSAANRVLPMDKEIYGEG